MSATNNTELPRPTAKTCAVAGCHDGTAFSITTACTKCHRDPPERSFTIARPDTRFSHATHATAKLACATCHRLATNGEVVAGGHGACATCHDQDFGDPRPRICGACHSTTEPWRVLVADRAPAETSEFGATLDHAKHPGACIGCHRLNTATRELRPPRGHSSCTGAGCHAVSTGPAPRLDACESCHQVGLATARDASSLTKPWSVRTGFSHTVPHRRAQGGAAITCETCHDDLRSPTVLSLATPPKRTCMPCHDGGAAFKLTGTSCARCHGGRK